jgi:hypothetical protein
MGGLLTFAERVAVLRPARLIAFHVGVFDKHGIEISLLSVVGQCNELGQTDI